MKIPSAARRVDAYPHELSGGLRQRAMIALALSCGPRLLLADEPTTALDATVQVQVLILLRRLQREMGMGTVLVTHDLGVAAEVADRVAVMYAGRVVEEGPVADVLSRPAHPYTAGLLASTVHDQAPGAVIAAIPGSPPDLRRLPPGCAFAPRCPLVMEACRVAPPPPVHPVPGRMARCLRVAERAGPGRVRPEGVRIGRLRIGHLRVGRPRLGRPQVGRPRVGRPGAGVPEMAGPVGPPFAPSSAGPRPASPGEGP